MNPRLHRGFWAAEYPADLGEAEILFKAEGQQRAVSPAKTEECVPHVFALDARQGCRCGIQRRSLASSVAQRGQQTAAVINREVDGHAHHTRPLMGLIAKPVAVLPQSQKGFMTNLLSDGTIEDHEVDRSDNERIEAAVKRLERGAAIVGFGHVSS